MHSSARPTGLPTPHTHHHLLALSPSRTQGRTQNRRPHSKQQFGEQREPVGSGVVEGSLMLGKNRGLEIDKPGFESCLGHFLAGCP